MVVTVDEGDSEVLIVEVVDTTDVKVGKFDTKVDEIGTVTDEISGRHNVGFTEERP